MKEAVRTDGTVCIWDAVRTDGGLSCLDAVADLNTDSDNSIRKDWAMLIL